MQIVTKISAPPMPTIAKTSGSGTTLDPDTSAAKTEVAVADEDAEADGSDVCEARPELERITGIEPDAEADPVRLREVEKDRVMGILSVREDVTDNARIPGSADDLVIEQDCVDDQ